MAAGTGSFWSLSFLSFVTAFAIALVLTPVIIRIASHHGWLDRPGFRKVHTSPVPRLGGVAIYIATWISWYLFTRINPNYLPYEHVRVFFAIFGASTLIWFVGIYDDLKGTNAWQKLFFQIIAAVIVTWNGVGIRLLHSVQGGDYVLTSESLVWVLTIGWIVIVTNAINLIDGLDGLAGGVCLITAATIYFIAKGLGHPDLPYFSLALAGGCLGFLIYNFSPARIFLGDSGSLFLGFVLACLTILGGTKRSTAIVMFGPPFILALPVADTLIAVVRRFLRKGGASDEEAPRDLSQNLFIRLREVFRADQEHIHHGLLKIGLSHRRAVVILYFVTALLGVTAYSTAIYDHLIGTGLVFLVLSGALFWLRHKVNGNGGNGRR